MHKIDVGMRVKHAWTEKVGTVLNIEGRIAFVKWDSEDAGSTFLDGLSPVLEWPAVRKCGVDTFVYFSNEDGYGMDAATVWNCGSYFGGSWSTLTDDITGTPAGQAAIARAEAWRKEQADPWPHWWKRTDTNHLVIYRYDSPNATGISFSESGWMGTKCLSGITDAKLDRYGHLVRITQQEADALLAKWRDDAKWAGARVWKARYDARVYVDGSKRYTHFASGKHHADQLFYTEAQLKAGGDTLLPPGPERDEYVAAAREGRDAVWPPKPEAWKREPEGYGATLSAAVKQMQPSPAPARETAEQWAEKLVGEPWLTSCGWSVRVGTWNVLSVGNRADKKQATLGRTELVRSIAAALREREGKAYDMTTGPYPDSLGKRVAP